MQRINLFIDLLQWFMFCLYACQPKDAYTEYSTCGDLPQRDSYFQNVGDAALGCEFIAKLMDRSLVPKGFDRGFFSSLWQEL